MAEIPVERKSSKAWLWILLAVLLVALLLWWLLSDAGEEETDLAEGSVATQQMDTSEPATTTSGMSIGDVLENPQTYLGRDDFQAEATVPADSELTDRGFWIEENGERLFALIIDQPMEEPKDINPGQRLRISEGMLRDSTYLSELSGNPLDSATQNIAESQDIFLVVDEENIEIIEAGNPQSGTTAAQTAPEM